mmetsp:Transcript_37618/g.107621  ORF Transcript_37618/g.107621 Transcript_37618/m.107621 type:complete len:306 (-) Transcript_37618:1001-1918(-)
MRTSQCRYHEAVPSGQHFVVTSRGGAAPAVRKEKRLSRRDERLGTVHVGLPLPLLVEALHQGREGAVLEEHVLPLELANGVALAEWLNVALVGDAEDVAEEVDHLPAIVSTQAVHRRTLKHLHNLWSGPHVEGALLLLSLVLAAGRHTVGVLCAVEATLGVPQLPQHIGDGLLHNALVQLCLGAPARPLLVEDLVGVGVDGDELALVVLHLLEVGDVPDLVDRVAVEAATQVIVHAALRHLGERVGHHVQHLGRLLGSGGVFPHCWGGRKPEVHTQQVLQQHWSGEFGRWAESPPLGVERLLYLG